MTQDPKIAVGLRCVSFALRAKSGTMDLREAAELRQFIERLERLAAEKQELSEQQKEVMAEVKSRGYDAKIVRKIIAMQTIWPRKRR